MEFEGYFFDLDGTVFLGSRLLPGAVETLSRLRKQGKIIRFLSNTTTQTRQECMMRLQRLGIEADREEVITASYAAALYLAALENEPQVMVIGGQSMIKELDEKGVKQTLDANEATHVLVGMDQQFDYNKLHQSLRAVQNGAQLIAANPDPFCPVENDRLPDTWSLVKALETASGVECQVIIGKPSAYYAEKVMEETGLSGGQCLMIGDRLDTDIMFGHDNGLHTALVLTGVATKADVLQSSVQPDFIWSSLEEFLDLDTTADDKILPLLDTANHLRLHTRL